MPEKRLIGKISHYYSKIGVAVLELSAELKHGDTISIESAAGSFEQPVESMQVEHKNVESAAAGSSVGLKVSQPVKPGAKVYKIKE